MVEEDLVEDLNTTSQSVETDQKSGGTVPSSQDPDFSP
jgi:hypothetical protein